MGTHKNKNTKRKKWVNLIFPLLTLFCLAGFIGSLIFPNYVLDTYIVNMEEEEGDTMVLLPLSYDAPITLKIDTKGRPMKGVQLGIRKRGGDQSGQILVYDVYAGDAKVSENRYDIASGDDGQYVYLPFANYEQCTGQIAVKLQLAGEGKRLSPEQTAALEANHRKSEDIETVLYEGCLAEGECSLRGSHIYTHATYPFLYDARILTFIFLAVSMTLSFKGKEG
ncbi:MAG: hypothetical protein K5739_10645 [Lachnospiraceae bacterium]|nr:hypothetical protein [Lachnospiraceae bacterium]